MKDARKTIRLMNLANKFNIPVISFIDTPVLTQEWELEVKQRQ